MKKLLLFAALALSTQYIKAQVGIGTVNPDNKVILHIQSENKGILLPEINDLTTAIKREGSLIYNTETKKFKYYISPNWISVNPLNADVNDNVTATGDVTVTNNLTVGLQAPLSTDANGEVAETGNLTVNGQRVDAPNATVTANTFIGNGTIPVGGIIMWSGKEIPEGWALCDGQNGTPDLRGRFIVGQSNNDTQNHGGYENSEKNNPDYLTIEATGGNNFVTLNTENVPAHSHDIKILSTEAGRHTHSYQTHNDDSDRYRQMFQIAGRGGYKNIEGMLHVTNDIDGKDIIQKGKDYDITNIFEVPSHQHAVIGTSGIAGGKYTWQTKINPPKLNAPEDCFNYKCTMNLGDIVYSSINLTNYSEIPNYFVDISPVFPQHGIFYDYQLIFYDNQGNEVQPPNNIQLPLEGKFKLSNQYAIHLRNINSCIEITPTKPYVNTQYDPRYAEGATIIYNEKWTTTPIDTRPAYYVLAFIMRVQ